MINHKSDCATHNMPAEPRGECDCGAQENPAIVALAKAVYEVNKYYRFVDETGKFDRIIEWDELDADERETRLDDARAAYAFVLKDLMEPSDAVVFAVSDHGLILDRGDARRKIQSGIRARAREIGVEVER